MDAQLGEIGVFKDFFKRGFGVPVHPFLQSMCAYYEIGLYNLHPNSILLVATFIHLCEAMVALSPILTIFAIFSVYGRKAAPAGQRLPTASTSVSAMG